MPLGTLLTDSACGSPSSLGQLLYRPMLLLLSAQFLPPRFASFEGSFPVLRLLFKHPHNIHLSGMLTLRVAFLQAVDI